MAFWGNCCITSKVMSGLEYINQNNSGNYECIIHHRSHRYNLNLISEDSIIHIWFRNTELVDYNTDTNIMHRSYFKKLDGEMCWREWEWQAKRAVEKYYNIKPKYKHFTNSKLA